MFSRKMTEKNQVYKCSVCGNVVSVIENGVGVLVCCDQDMKLLNIKKEEEGKEKHIPVVSVEGNKVHVKVGSVEHPMEEKHYIERIELFKGNKLVGQFQLNYTEKPEADFCVDNPEGIKARIFCNVHGLWSN